MTVERTEKKLQWPSLTVFYAEHAPTSPSAPEQRTTATASRNTLHVPVDVKAADTESGKAETPINVAASIPQPPSPSSTTTTNYTRSIQIKAHHKTHNQLMRELIAVTGAKEVEPSDEEVAQMEQLKQEYDRAEADRTRVAGILAEKKREEEMLKAARGEVARLRAEA